MPRCWPCIFADRTTARRASELLKLAVAIVGAYERLHELGVIHADVNPRNLLIGPDETVRILDFGLATSEKDPVHGFLPRGGWSYLYEPEAADNFLHGGRGSTPTRLGEQYSLGGAALPVVHGKVVSRFQGECGGDVPADPRRCSARFRGA